MKRSSKIQLSLLFAAVVASATGPYWAQDPKGATAALESAGLTPVKVGTTAYTDFPFFSCPTSTYSTAFEAATKDGKKVTGNFCSGPFFKGTGIEFTTPK